MPGRADPELTLRLSWAEVLPAIGSWVLVAAMGLFVAQVAKHPVGRWFWVVLVLLGLSQVALAVVRPQFRLTTTEIVVYGFRRRQIPWAQVQAVTWEWRSGKRRVVLWVDGQPTPLCPITIRAPSPRQIGPRYQAILEWWAAHQGPTWQPPAGHPPWPHLQPPLTPPKS